MMRAIRLRATGTVHVRSVAINSSTPFLVKTVNLRLVATTKQTVILIVPSPLVETELPILLHQTMRPMTPTTWKSVTVVKIRPTATSIAHFLNAAMEYSICPAMNFAMMATQKMMMVVLLCAFPSKVMPVSEVASIRLDAR